MAAANLSPRRDGVDSPDHECMGPRHYCVPRHYLGGPFNLLYLMDEDGPYTHIHTDTHTHTRRLRFRTHATHEVSIATPIT